MRRTYAYSGIIFGFLIGLLVWGTTNNIVLSVLAGIGVSVVAFIIIRVIENALYKGASKVADKAQQAYRDRKEQKAMQNGTYMPQSNVQPTQFPNRNAQPTQFPNRDAQPTQFPNRNAQPAPAEQQFCSSCGKQVNNDSVFCPFCGNKID